MAHTTEDAPQGAGGSLCAILLRGSCSTSALADAIRERLPAAAVPDVIDPGRLTRFSSNGRRSDDAGFVLLFPDGRGAIFGCWRTGLSETWSAYDTRRMTPADRIALARHVERAKRERDADRRRQWDASRDRIERLASECWAVQPGDPVALYLRRRGIDRWPLPACLRLHPRLAYWHEGRVIGHFPSMVAPVVDVAGRVLALHRTWLTDDGQKAPVEPVRKLTRAAGPVAGGCIALASPRAGVLGIAEGIETALAASCASGLPVVAAYSAGNLASWHWPLTSRRIVVFADADEAGRTAADKLHARAVAAGLSAQVVAPSVEGEDWADVWTTRTAMRAGLDAAEEVVR